MVAERNAGPDKKWWHVGHTIILSAAIVDILQASLLPCSQDINIIWPQLLAKALQRTKQA